MTEEAQPEKMKSELASMIEHSDLAVESMLTKNERLVVRGHIHWGIYWKPAAVLLFGFLLSLFVIELGTLLLIVGLLMLGHAVMVKKFILLALTNKRILTRYGLLQMEVVDIRFSKIESVELERMLPGMLLGYANVVIMGVGQRYFRIPYIANAVQFRRMYNEIVLESEGVDDE